LLSCALVVGGNCASSLNDTALLGYSCLDSVDIEINVDLICYRFGERVFTDEVLLKEPESLLGRGGCKPNDVCIEILDYVAP
jgi:hypothetical protein